VGILFGLALQIKLISLIWTPLAVLLICYRQMPASQPQAGQSETLPVFLSTAKSAVVIKHLLIFGITLILAWLAVDLIVDQGAYLANFQQSWQSHFAAVKTKDYGSPTEHVFEWAIFARNWDTVVPALVGVIVAVRGFRRQVSLLFPFVWFVWALVVFVNHKPWWPYYYIHLAIPLCWLAAMGWQSVIQTCWSGYKTGKKTIRSRKTWKSAEPLAGAVILSMLMVLWMGGRIYLQIASMRAQPRIFSSLVIAEVERYRPYTHWLFADDPVLSFHTDIPMPPSLAVVPLKRLWSGEMTAERMTEEFSRYQPELAILNNANTATRFRISFGLSGQSVSTLCADKHHRASNLNKIG
jgi:hypothetical protein